MDYRNRYDGCDEYAVSIIRRKARQLRGRKGFVKADIKDIEQELMLDLLRRLQRFDSRRAQKTTFIAMLVRNHAATLIEARTAELRDYRREAGSLDTQREDDGGASDDCPPVLDTPEYRRATIEAAHRDEDLRAMQRELHAAIADLPPDLQDLCLRLFTETVTEIAQDTNTPRGTVYEAIGRVRKHFERAGLRVYLERADTSRKLPVSKKKGPQTAPAETRRPR